MKNFKESYVLNVMRRQWNSKLNRLSETVDAVFKGKIDGQEKTLIDVDLKLRHKESQYLYTVVSVGKDEVVLKNPEGRNFIVGKKELEDEYEID